MTSDNALEERLKFLRLDADALQRLQAAKSVVMSALPGALDDFYAGLQAQPETRAMFRDAAHMSSAKDRQARHWETIASGKLDAEFVGAATAVGEKHARVGLQPRWYIAGYALLIEALVGAVIEARWQKGGLFAGKGASAADVKAEIGALIKAALLDMDYTTSVYLDAAETARAAAETEVLAKERAAVVASVGDGMAHLSAGDLTYRMPDNMPAEYRQLHDDFNDAVGKLQQTLVTVVTSAGGINTGADEIAEASDDLSRRTEQQAASLEETAAALDEITATMKKSAQGARQASDAVGVAKGVAEQSGDVVREAVSAMDGIERSSQQISQIIGVIDEIAFQTNLLALNAGVEAARAGDAGRGFAVVAQEVRALAQRSAEAAKEIKALISTSSQQVGRGVDLVAQTGKALESIVTHVAQIDGLVSEITASAQEQATGLHEVNTAVNQMDQVVQQNAAMVEQSTAASHSLKGETAELLRLVSEFRLGGAAQRPAPQLARRNAAPSPSPARALTRKVAASFGAVAVADDDGWKEF